MSLEHQRRIFTANVKVGSCGSGQEEGLGAMEHALAQMGPGGCNEGFLRPDANLVVIIMSDEDDQSELATDVYLAALGRAKPRGYAQLRVALIVGSVGGSPEPCRVSAAGKPTDACGSLCARCPVSGVRESWCSSVRFWDLGVCSWCGYYRVADCCSAFAGTRYIDFALEAEQLITEADPSIQRTHCRASAGEPSACVIDSICQATFSTTLERIATELILSVKSGS